MSREMARALEEYRREREVPCRNNPWDQAVPETIFRNTDSGESQSESERGGGGGVQAKELITVLVKDGRMWISTQLLNKKLEDVLVDLQHNARVLHIIDPDELIVRLVLVRTDGLNLLEVDMASTLNQVRVGMVEGDMLVALLRKITPSSPVPATVPFAVEGHTTIAEHVTDNSNLLYTTSANAYAQPEAIHQRQTEDRAMEKSRRGQSSSSSVWSSVAPSLPVVPSWSEGNGNSQPDHVAFINALQPPGVQVRDFSESSLNSHASVTKIGRAPSQTKLKSTRNKLGVSRRPRLRNLDYQRYFAETFAHTTRILKEAEELLARLQRWEQQRLVDRSNVDLAGARGEMVQREGDEIEDENVDICSCLEE